LPSSTGPDTTSIVVPAPMRAPKARADLEAEQAAAEQRVVVPLAS
jgi:hypothetical protein